MKTVLLTGGGGAGTIAAARSLKRLGNYKVILGDMYEWTAGLRFADKSYVLPAGGDERFIKAVEEIIVNEKVDVLVPLVDEEILKVYDFKKKFPKLKILLPESSFSEIVLDKMELVFMLKSLKLPYPKTRLALDSLAGLNYPVIIKPRRGRGSRNVMEINSKNQIQAYKVLTGMAEKDILIQEKILGKEFTVSVAVNEYGKVFAVVPKEIICKRGVTIAAVTRKNSHIEELCLNIQERLKPNGPFNVQLVLTEDNVPIVFEINPRFSTTIALTLEAGINEIDVLSNDKEYLECPMPYAENLVMTRFYDQLFFGE